MKMKINGTLINYYFFCKTKCWLFGNRINLEDNSEDVRIGKILHEIDEKKSDNGEIEIENIKIDKLTRKYLVEMKKSDSDIEAVKWQLLLYLYKLKQKGVIRKGKIEFVENKRESKKIHFVELNETNEKEILKVVKKINNLINKSKPPKPKFKKHCKKCAYYEYCFI